MKNNLLTPGEIAPDFELRDTLDRQVRLSDFRGRPVVLAFLRGFM
jgi:peroxiredoxin